ncbi:MAG: SDR family NAD(P)-dependent oxidoreductase [Planctomycetes bacterium]|nr:SDR family NAD(P)-dependent oxidoreductase [Planctomycetota bacterium]
MALIACITGVTSGIGKAAAERFMREGWKVVGTGRRADRLKALAAELGEAFYPLLFDVRDKEAVEEAFSSLPECFSPIDLLVNNAGLALGREPAWDALLDDWDTMVDTNIKGFYYCIKAVLAAMVKRGKGHIINIGSIAGSNGYPGGNTYSASKAFVHMFSQNLRCDLHGTGVRVTTVEPGMVESEFSLVRFKGDAQKADVYSDIDPLTTDDMADILYYVACLPQHVNISRVEVMPVCQSTAGFRLAAKSK